MNARAETVVEADLIISGAGDMLTCADKSRGLAEGSAVGRIVGGAVAAREGRVVWVGDGSRLSDEVRLLPGGRSVEADGRVVMPGLVECHSHPVFFADRADEFQLRVAGATYQEVSAAGGGIMSTVHSTRSASDAMLRSLTRRRLDRFLGYGVTTVEAKSGYGLTLEHELRLLEVCRDVAAEHAVDVVPTLLAAHAVPVEYAGRADAYVDVIVKKIIPAAAKRKLARFCDALCDEWAYSPSQCRRILEAGLAHGLAPKLHADQLTSGGGTEMAAELQAVSVDHLDRVSDAGVAAVAAKPGPRRVPVAVLLPGATFFLDQGGRAPARRLLDAGARVALSTDFNPGSSPTQNLWLMATMGCSQLKMTAEEVIRALTIEAAAALALEGEVGSLEVGKKADILILEYARYAEIPYRYGMNPVWRVYKAGRLVVERSGKEEVEW